MSLPGMRERAVRIGSCGQDVQPDRLEGRLRHRAGRDRERDRESASEPDLHHAAQPAERGRAGLAKDEAYFAELAGGLAAKRDRLAAGLRRRRDDGAADQGSYFVTADFAPLGFAGDDEAFCRYITEHAGVTAIPLSAFHVDNPPRQYARFAFCKQDAVLDEALAARASLRRRARAAHDAELEAKLTAAG